jgi:hypothetical protein
MPVKLRYRRDGLTPGRQVGVIQAIAECGCMREACARVGISAESVYKLLRRPDAQSFRVALDLALDGAVDRVEDGAFSRALNGVEIPHYYKGELVGTHRRHDEQLTMFILRYRKPHRYGRHLDREPATRHPEKSALGLADALTWVEVDAHRDAAGLRRRVGTRHVCDEDETWDETHLYRWGPAAGAPPEGDDPDALDDLDEDDPDPVESAFSPGVSSTSSTSGLRQGFGRQAAADNGAKAVRRSSEGAKEDSRRNRRARRAAAARGRKR